MRGLRQFDKLSGAPPPLDIDMPMAFVPPMFQEQMGGFTPFPWWELTRLAIFWMIF
jgi:hypothetical protein